MLALLTNDDGIHALGLRSLIKETSRIARVLVVAPDREQSATSHALTLHRPLRLNKLDKNLYAVDGTPTDAVMIAVHGLLKGRRPDVLISGINHGPNMGDDVTYSGTVAAAIEGTILGIPSMAISYVDKTAKDFTFAARIARKLVAQMLNKRLPAGTFLNVNVPIVRKGKFRGRRFDSSSWAITRLGNRVFNDIIVEKTDPQGRLYYWIGGEPSWQQEKESDFSTIAAKKVSITPLKIDLTNYEVLSELANWKIRL